MVTVLCEDQKFSSRRKVVIQPGFKDIEAVFRKTAQKKAEKPEESKNTSLPDGLVEGMEFLDAAVKVNRHYTTPPKAYNEDTLLAAMETAGNPDFEKETEKKGLGTPATRASMIEKLMTSGYAERKGKQILPTTSGRELIRVLPDYLKSASMTAEWENRLLLVEKGELKGEVFLQEVEALIDSMLEDCRCIPEEVRRRFHPRESIGICPLCGSPVYEGKKIFTVPAGTALLLCGKRTGIWPV